SFFPEANEFRPPSPDQGAIHESPGPRIQGARRQTPQQIIYRGVWRAGPPHSAGSANRRVLVPHDHVQRRDSHSILRAAHFERASRDRPGYAGAALRPGYFHGRGSGRAARGARPRPPDDADEEQAPSLASTDARRNRPFEAARALRVRVEPPLAPGIQQGRTKNISPAPQEICTSE